MDLPSIDLPTQLPDDGASSESTAQNLRFRLLPPLPGTPLGDASGLRPLG